MKEYKYNKLDRFLLFCYFLEKEIFSYDFSGSKNRKTISHYNFVNVTKYWYNFIDIDPPNIEYKKFYDKIEPWFANIFKDYVFNYDIYDDEFITVKERSKLFRDRMAILIFVDKYKNEKNIDVIHNKVELFEKTFNLTIQDLPDKEVGSEYDRYREIINNDILSSDMNKRDYAIELILNDDEDDK